MPATADFFQAGPRNWRARLAISVDLMRELSRYTDPDETYQVFARRMTQLYPTVRQLSLSRRGLERPAFRVTRFNLWDQAANPFRDADELPVRRGGLLADLLYADEPRVIDDLDAVELSPDDPARQFLHGQRSVLSVPLFEQGTAQNLLVVTRTDPHAFPREQVPELVWMSNLFGRAVQAQVLGDKVRELYEAAEYELRAIADLQHSLLPAAVPDLPGLDVAVHYRTANRAGGDYYDFFPLSDGRLGVLLADVSGHGTPAAVLLAITHGLAHTFGGPMDRPGQFLGYLNRHLAAKYTVTTGHFVTALYAVFDPAADKLTYAVAGHPPPRLDVAGTWSVAPAAQRLPLGVSVKEPLYPEQTVHLPAGGAAAFVTDGIPDATDEAGEPFGDARLDAALAGDGPAEAVVRRALAAVDAHASDTPADDDRTLLVVRRA